MPRGRIRGGWGGECGAPVAGQEDEAATASTAAAAAWLSVTTCSHSIWFVVRRSDLLWNGQARCVESCAGVVLTCPVQVQVVAPCGAFSVIPDAVVVCAMPSGCLVLAERFLVPWYLLRVTWCSVAGQLQVLWCVLACNVGLRYLQHAVRSCRTCEMRSRAVALRKCVLISVGTCRRGHLVIAKCDLVRFMAAICGSWDVDWSSKSGKLHQLMAGYDVRQWVGDMQRCMRFWMADMDQCVRDLGH
jgi:hypothetical protein